MKPPAERELRSYRSLAMYEVSDIGDYLEGRQVTRIVDGGDRSGWQLDDGTVIWCYDVEADDIVGTGGWQSADEGFPLNATITELRYGDPADDEEGYDYECSVWATVGGEEHLLMSLGAIGSGSGPTIEVTRPDSPWYKPIKP